MKKKLRFYKRAAQQLIKLGQRKQPDQPAKTVVEITLLDAVQHTGKHAMLVIN